MVGRTTRIATIEDALARVGDAADAARVLLDRLDSRPDPHPAIAEANLTELVRIVLALHDIRLLLVRQRSEV